MTSTFTRPTADEIETYLRRAREERSEAFATIARRLWTALKGVVRAEGGAPTAKPKAA